MTQMTSCGRVLAALNHLQPDRVPVGFSGHRSSGIAVGGQVRSIYVGELPIGPQEICRRQIALHEMIDKAAHEGDDSLAVQALCLDPYVRSLSQARNIWRDLRKEYKDYLTTFK
jgi:alpha-galactosidase/6-phospho-beta-glucosidase family protein